MSGIAQVVDFDDGLDVVVVVDHYIVVEGLRFVVDMDDRIFDY